MPSITYDARSFLLDARRFWIVSGSIQYAMCPRALWPEAIRLAKQAGLNTIDTSVLWSRHEPRMGHFDFSADADLRHFLKLVAEADLHAVLRVGPYVGLGADFGGLPAWLANTPNVHYRAPNGPFLEASSRFLTALLDQIRDLQATSPKGGPIVLVQLESAWTCGNDELAEKYLGELQRYLREGGLTVPIANANNLWQRVEGQIDAWAAGDNLLSTSRQLVTVRPDHPRLMIDAGAQRPAAWGAPEPAPEDPCLLQRRLAEALAGAAQFNISPFHAGTHVGFGAGRLPEPGDAFACPLPFPDAPLTAHASLGPSFHPVRRIATFASRFARVFANLDPAFRPSIADPDHDGLAIVPVTGPQGGVVFAFAPRDPDKPAPDRAAIMLPDGTSLTLHLGSQRVAWALTNVSLGGRAVLDWAGLNALAHVGKILVCFGPAGVAAQVSINGSPLEVVVPRGKSPLVLEHEGITLVVASEQQADEIQVTDHAVYFPASGVTASGDPIPVEGARQCVRLLPEGGSSTISFKAPRNEPARRPAARESLGGWTSAPAADHVEGRSARFAAIQAPADLGAMGTPYGYGWYRATFKSPGARRVPVMAPRSGDRLHLFLNSKLVGIVGLGPGADRAAALPLARGVNTLVVLAENFGRASAGTTLGEPKGLFGPIVETRPIRVPRPVVKPSDPVNLLAFRAPLWEIQQDETTIARRLAWTLPKGKRQGIIIDVRGLRVRALLLVNGTPVEFLDRGTHRQILLDPSRLGRGATHVDLAFLAELADEADLAPLAAAVSFHAVVADATPKPEWAFARWEPPPASAYHPPRKGAPHAPTWWKGVLRLADAARPRLIDLSSMSKGQCYVNGRHLGRYFSATATGKRVGPQTGLELPASWLHEGDNEIVLFDEHGFDPSRCKERPVA